MSLKKRTLLTAALLVLTFIIGGWVSKSMDPGETDFYYQVKKNISSFGRVYQEISNRYVEEIDPDEFIQAGINGMLAKLDPHTVYIEKDQTDELQIMTSGKYGGLGMLISKRNEWPTIVDPPFDDTPAQRAQIREGDQIIEIDGVSTRDLSISETARRLRGKKGSSVRLLIRRQGHSDPLEFNLVRDEINPHDIVYSGFVKPGIGYIRLGRFGRNSITEVQDAITTLKNRGMESLIFDVRYNPGGLLDAAVAVADNFFEPDQLIVATRGRSENSNQKFYAKKKALLADEPLVVLVSGYSASASEIVAGAVQDLDRGIVIGESTFGKGLVQTVVQINRDDAIKITTAKYYTPSGRCIQKPDVFVRGSDSVFMNKNVKTDSTKKEVYKTRSGRVVYGDGGIKPDITIESQKVNRYIYALLQKSMFFNFALDYVARYPDLNRDFVVDEKLVEEFKTYLKRQSFEGEIEGEDELKDFEKVIQEQNYTEAIKIHIEAIREKLTKEKDAEFEKDLELIRQRLDYEIASKLWGLSTAIERSFTTDETIQKAINVIENPGKYTSILTASGEVGSYVLK